MGEVVKYELGNITDEDRKLFKPIANSFLLNHNNSTKKIKSPVIIKGLRNAGYSITEAGFRKIIGYLRSIDYFNPGFILSDGEGYWYSEDKTEMKKFYSSMKFRALSILHNIKPINKRIIQAAEMLAEKEITLFEII